MPRDDSSLQPDPEQNSRVQRGDSTAGSKATRQGAKNTYPKICHADNEKQRSSRSRATTGRDRSRCGISALRSTTIPLRKIPCFGKSLLAPFNVQMILVRTIEVCSWALVSYRTIVLRVRYDIGK